MIFTGCSLVVYCLADLVSDVFWRILTYLLQILRPRQLSEHCSRTFRFVHHFVYLHQFLTFCITFFGFPLGSWRNMSNFLSKLFDYMVLGSVLQEPRKWMQVPLFGTSYSEETHWSLTYWMIRLFLKAVAGHPGFPIWTSWTFVFWLCFW
jgi:hypothetical protein